MTETVPRWKNRPPRHMAEIKASDQPRLNALVAQLDDDLPGRWRQKDAISYLLDFHDLYRKTATTTEPAP